MFLQRSALAAARRAAISPIAARSFTTSLSRREAKATPPATNDGKTKLTTKLEEIKTEEDLLAPGAAAGTVPTDIEQATGLERLEILGKMQGIDVFDMRPLDASRKGTMENPIVVKSAGDEQYCGCTGYPADSHITIWLTISRNRPVERCPECGSVYKMDYIGPAEDPHAHGHGDHGHGHGHEGDYPSLEEPKTFADFVKPEYYYK